MPAWYISTDMFRLSLMNEQVVVEMPMICKKNQSTNGWMKGRMTEWTNQPRKEAMKQIMNEPMAGWFNKQICALMEQRVNESMSGLTERINEWNWWANEKTKTWKKERKNEWINEWMNERMNEWANEWMSERVNEWTDAGLNEWLNDWMDDWMNKWMDE